MLKENKWKITVSSIVILLPILFGLIMWERLPEEMITHWGINGEADGWNSRLFTVFVLPVILLVTHWVCIIFTSLDRKNREQNKKVFGMIFWIMPVVSVFVNGAVYMAVFGKEFGIERAEIIIIGLMFVIIGNYLPKCKQNYTIGIKLPWTLSDEENWNKTHRFGGKLWVIGGVAVIIVAFLPTEIMVVVFLMIIVVMAIVPMIYSYFLYKNK